MGEYSYGLRSGVTGNVQQIGLHMGDYGQTHQICSLHPCQEWLFYGQVGAGVGAVLGSGTGQTAPIKTSVHKNDTRRAKLFMKLNGENVCIDFTSNSANFEHLLQIMPEKNVEWVQKHQTEKQEQTSTADELLKFKNLLDQGVITQEEFDKKKTQLLGN